MHHLSGQWRCITFNARGYPPSDVPETEDRYGVEFALRDIGAVLDHLDIPRVHLVGTSMGGYAAIRYALAHPDRVCSLVAMSVGGGSPPRVQATFREKALQWGNRFLSEGASAVGTAYANNGSRKYLQLKSPDAFSAYVDFCSRMSAIGAGMSMSRVQALRASLETFEASLKSLDVPTLLILGDEDHACHETTFFLKRVLPNAGLAMVPLTGHAVAQEEPEHVSRLLATFLRSAEAGNWRKLD